MTCSFKNIKSCFCRWSTHPIPFCAPKTSTASGQYNSSRHWRPEWVVKRWPWPTGPRFNGAILSLKCSRPRGAMSAQTAGFWSNNRWNKIVTLTTKKNTGHILGVRGIWKSSCSETLESHDSCRYIEILTTPKNPKIGFLFNIASSPWGGFFSGAWELSSWSTLDPIQLRGLRWCNFELVAK